MSNNADKSVDKYFKNIQCGSLGTAMFSNKYKKPWYKLSTDVCMFMANEHSQ